MIRTVEETLSSPFHEVRALVDQFRNGDLDAEQFLDELDEYDERLGVLYEGIAAEPETAVEDDPELLEDAVAGVHLFSDASERLREFVEDREEEVATEALEMARKAHDRWVELVELRGDLLSLIKHRTDDDYRPAAVSDEYWG